MKFKPNMSQAAFLLAAFSAGVSGAQGPAPSTQVAVVAALDASGASHAMNAASLGFSSTAVGSSEKVAVSLSLAGYSGGAVPQISAHYGRDYSLTPASCSASACQVEVTFHPTLPGARPDALFITAGGQRLGTILLSGSGKGPMMLIEPAAASTASIAPTGLSSVVDENGTLYTLDPAAGTVFAQTTAGATQSFSLDGIQGARALAIDGAGVLYLLPGGAAPALVTFDTVQRTVGSVPLPVAASLVDSFVVAPDGDVLAVSGSANLLYKLSGSGVVSTIPVQGAGQEAVSGLVAGATSGQLLAGGSGLSQISSVTGERTALQGVASGIVPLAIDAAGSIYGSSGGIAQQWTAAGTSVATLPGLSAVAEDGTLFLASGRVARSSGDLGFKGAGDETAAVTLYNGGNAPLELSEISLNGAGYLLPSAAAGDCSAGSTVAAGATCQLQVERLASAAADATATVLITSNSGNVAGSVAQVVAHPYATVSAAALSPTSLAFTSTTVNVASAGQSITLTNTGGAALNFASIAITGTGSGSYTETNTCFTTLPASLAAGASCVITVVFKPLAVGTQTASLSVVDDAGGVANSAQTAALSGVAVAAPAPVIAISPTSLTFGSTTVATSTVIAGNVSAPLVFTVTNSGNAVANISSLGLTTTLASLPFTSTTTCGTTLAATATCTVSVTFAPTVGGTFTASLAIADNAPGTPQTGAITGYATAGDFNVTVSASSMTVPSSGGSGSLQLTATPSPSPFPTPVTFSVFGMPAGATYAFNPATLSPMTAAANTTFTVTLPSYHAVTLSQLENSWPGRRPVLPAAAFAFSGLCLVLRRRRLPRLTAKALQLALLAGLALGAISVSGCSGYPISGGVAPGNYTLTITGTSANGQPTSTLFPVTHQVVVNLVVQ